MGNKIKAGRLMVNEDDRNNRIDYYDYDYWHRFAKYQVGPNVHFFEHRLINDDASTVASYICALEYILQNPRRTGLGSLFNPMAHYDNREYDKQCKIRDALILSDDIQLDRDDCYDEDDLS